jgi:hypothetical protein
MDSLVPCCFPSFGDGDWRVVIVKINLHALHGGPATQLAALIEKEQEKDQKRQLCITYRE